MIFTYKNTIKNTLLNVRLGANVNRPTGIGVFAIGTTFKIG